MKYNVCISSTNVMILNNMHLYIYLKKKQGYPTFLNKITARIKTLISLDTL